MICALAFVIVRPPRAGSADDPAHVFEGHGDVGPVRYAGSAAFNPAGRSYTVTGGENMWVAKDAFNFVWTEAAGGLFVTADVAFAGAGKDPHRKACLVIRQSLAADAADANVALHGDGLTLLQFRDARGRPPTRSRRTSRPPRGCGLSRGEDTR